MHILLLMIIIVNSYISFNPRLLYSVYVEYIPTASCELPYEGAKEMLLVDEIDDKEFLIKNAGHIGRSEV